jgi:hypothetical protein
VTIILLISQVDFAAFAGTFVRWPPAKLLLRIIIGHPDYFPHRRRVVRARQIPNPNSPDVRSFPRSGILMACYLRFMI